VGFEPTADGLRKRGSSNPPDLKLTSPQSASDEQQSLHHLGANSEKIIEKFAENSKRHGVVGIGAIPFSITVRWLGGFGNLKEVADVWLCFEEPWLHCTF